MGVSFFIAGRCCARCGKFPAWEAWAMGAEVEIEDIIWVHLQMDIVQSEGAWEMERIGTVRMHST